MLNCDVNYFVTVTSTARALMISDKCFSVIYTAVSCADFAVAVAVTSCVSVLCDM